jgi:DNA-binding transcriptional ArsR family regulator
MHDNNGGVVAQGRPRTPEQKPPQAESGRPGITPGRRQAAIALLRKLRELDEAVGVRHSGIARDVGLLLYEHAERGLSVNQISTRTGYSGPTVRLVLDRLTEAKATCPGLRQGKTQLYRLTPLGLAGFDAYVLALSGFAEAIAARRAVPGAAAAVSGAAVPTPAPGPAADQQPPPARCAAAPSGREAAR